MCTTTNHDSPYTAFSSVRPSKSCGASNPRFLSLRDVSDVNLPLRQELLGIYTAVQEFLSTLEEEGHLRSL